MAAAASSAGAAAEPVIDQNLYSRQLAVYGEAMGKLVQMDVLIVGMRGLGVEVAKNIILAGPKSVTLFDTELATISDVGANYYLTPACVGKPRAACVVAQLAELNPYVSVTVLPALEITAAALSRFDVVVATNQPRARSLQLNEACRAAKPQVGFIATEVRGVSGSAFVDFGDAFVVRDPNGEQCKNAIISSISRSNPGIVFTVDTKRHGFEEGDYVIFREVEGMTELNDAKPRRIHDVKPFSFKIEEDTSSFHEHEAGGIVEQTKVPTTVSFASLATRTEVPVPADEPMGMITPDYGKFGRPEQLHVAYVAVERFRNAHGQLPRLRNAEDAAAVVGEAKAFVASLEGKETSLAGLEVDEAVVRTVALTARAELPALCAFYGGVVAQEIVKFTGKFSPLRQWLYLDAFEVLPKEHEALPAEEYAPMGSRYDGLVALLGKTQQERIMNQRVFVVGAGALGCEFLKNYALMGVGCGPAGQVTVTDMDRIEVSNLNRQFLFRAPNVGHPKSVTAAAAAQVMNPDFKVNALETPVGEDTEGTFNDAFWSSLDVVTNALDNLKARQYVDHRCIFFCKPLLESGTLGTKANTQVVVPTLTECYSDSVDPPEESIPMCTLRNFPYSIEHCIEWARDLFAGNFTNAVQEAVAFLEAPGAWLDKVADESNLAQRRSKLTDVTKVLKAAATADWRACVLTVRDAMHAQFNESIKQLLTNFPADYTDPATGVKFWSPPKRVPTPLELDVSDPVQLSFLVHGAALVAANFGVPLPADYDSQASIAAILATSPLPEFVPKVTRIKMNEADTTVEGSEDDLAMVESLAAELRALMPHLKPDSYKLAPAEFEKDDDSNHHIDYITAASNLRARNYRIREVSRYDVKLTAGKIIPAIATTTCAITGLVCLEFYKLVAGAPVEAVRNTFMNLAVNVYSMAEPMPPKRTRTVAYDRITMGPVKAVPEGFTHWDKLVLRMPGATPAMIDAALKEKHGVHVTMITCGSAILYNPLLYRSHREQRANKAVVDIMNDSAGSDVTSGKDYIMLSVSVEDDDGDVLIPPVQVFYK